MSQAAEHWVGLAQSWDLRGSPLRPAEEDIRILGREFRQWHDATKPGGVRVLLLGVTPEIASMQWPAATHLLAVDQAAVMIRYVWPGAALGYSAVCAKWARLPLHAMVPEPAALAQRLNWHLPEIRTIDDYRDIPARCTFPTLRETRAALANEFEEIACHFPRYELGERCPTLAFRPR